MEEQYPQLPPLEEKPEENTKEQSPEDIKQQRKMMFGIIGGGVLFLAVFIAITIGLASPSTATDKIRDIVIIFMGLEFLFIGLVLVILIVQIARLINLLQNEIKPILDSTNETVNTLKGTAEFIGDNLSEPIIKMNEYLAAFSELGKFFRAFRKK